MPTATRSRGTFGTEHPVGTGPFKFDEWIRNDHLTLTRNDDYWGAAPYLDSVIFRPITDNAARLQALETGEIDGYDLVDPQDRAEDACGLQAAALRAAGVQRRLRGLQLGHPPLDNPEVRQAIAYA